MSPEEIVEAHAGLIRRWGALLRTLASRYDLADSEGRADFRGALFAQVDHLKASFLREIADEVGADRERSRAALARSIASQIIAERRAS